MYDWIKYVGLNAPSKVAVANWLVENNWSAPSAEGAAVLTPHHVRLMRALGLERDGTLAKAGRTSR